MPRTWDSQDVHNTARMAQWLNDLEGDVSTGAGIADLSVTTPKLADAAVTSAKIDPTYPASLSIAGTQLTGTIATARLGTGSDGSGTHTLLDNGTWATAIDGGVFLSTYQNIRSYATRWDNATAVTVFFVNNQTTPSGVGGAAAGLAVFYLDSAAYGVTTGFTLKLNLHVQALVNATAPAVTFTTGLYPITAVAGAASNLTITAGTVVTGSTVAFASPGASTLNQANSGDFTFPTAGAYAIGVVSSGTATVNSGVGFIATLRYRMV